MSIRDFQIISKLGEGAYSSVYKVKRLSDNQEYALKKVKLMNLSDKEKLNALNEVRILASIRHPNMIAYKEAFLDESSNSLCIVMEYANNGDLFQKIVEHQKKGTLFSEQEIWNIFTQVSIPFNFHPKMVKGIKSLHDMKIYHRDLKSANIFLNKDGTVKLGDLNVSKVAKKGLLYTQTGTPYYASPEVWRDMPYDHKSDVWSLGCVLYEMTTLKPPFRAEDMEGLYKKVLKDKILLLPAVQKRVTGEPQLTTEVDEGIQSNLLSTIRIPKNLHFLTERLPKPNYAPLKVKKVDKSKTLMNNTKDEAIEEATHNQEVEMPMKKDKNHSKEPDYNRVHLPSLGVNSNRHDDDIVRAYGAGTKEKKQVKPLADILEGKGISPSVYDDSPGKKVVQDKKKKIKVSHLRDKSEDYEEPTEMEIKQSPKNPVLKVHDLNKDVDRHLESLKNIYGTKVNKPVELSPLKEYPAKRTKPLDDYDDYSSKKSNGKLPPIGALISPNEGASSKLPPLNNDIYKKSKLKEISKVYKVNIGDEVLDRYVPAKAYKKEKLKDYGGARLNPEYKGAV